MRFLQKWLGKLSVRNKFLLLGLAGLVAIGIPAYQALNGLYVQWTVADGEVRGSPPARAILDVLVEVREVRGLNALVAGGDASAAAQRDAAIDETDAAIAALEASLAGRGQFVDANATLAEAKGLWAPVAADARAGAIDAASNVARFAQPTDAFDRVLDRIRDESGYSYTPFVDSYHLMFAALTVGPKLEDLLADARGRGLNYLGGGAVDPIVRGQVRSLAAEIAEANATFDRELDKAVAENPAIGEAVAAARQASNAALAKAFAQIDALAQPPVDGEVLPAPGDYYATLTDGIRAHHALEVAMLDELAKLSNANGDRASRLFWADAALIGGIIAAIALIVFGFAAQAIGATTHAVRAANNIAQLKLDNRIEARSEDEFGDLMRALATMQRELKERIERERVIATENARVRNALDVATSGMMIADNDGVILYMNPAVRRVLKDGEVAMRERLPGFRADQVMGSTFDVFHRDPAHQRTLIAGLTTTHKARLTMGDMHFELAASPMFDAEGQRIGTALEWQDRTADTKFRHQLRNVAQKAAAGILDARVEAQTGEERYAELARIFNSLMDLTAQAIGEVKVTMAALAQGDLTVRSSARLMGSFGELNDNANATADALARAIGEVQAAVSAINDAAVEIASGNMDLSKRTEQAAASIEGQDRRGRRQRDARHRGQLAPHGRHHHDHRRHRLPDQHPGPQRRGGSRARRRAGPRLRRGRQRGARPGAALGHGGEGDRPAHQRVGGEDRRGRQRRAARRAHDERDRRLVAEGGRHHRRDHRSEHRAGQGARRGQQRRHPDGPVHAGQFRPGGGDGRFGPVHERPGAPAGGDCLALRPVRRARSPDRHQRLFRHGESPPRLEIPAQGSP